MAAAVANDPMLPQPHRVRQVVKETPDTFTLTLEPSDGAGSSPLPAGTVQHAVGVRSWRVTHLD